MLKIRVSWITCASIALTIAAGCGQSKISEQSDATVIEVIDGDTMDLLIGGHRQRVRLIGVDTPETKHPRKPIQCFGPEAAAYTKSMLAKGTKVRLERDSEGRDVYDRLLVYLFRDADDLFINLELVRLGFAHVLTIEPNIAYLDKFVTASRDAQSRNLGLWQACRG